MLADGYALRDGPPDVAAYLRLRGESGLTPKTRAQAQAALPGSWCARHAVHEPTGDIVGMGRVIGDGGWYFHIVDVAVLPDHRRRGIADAILTELVTEIRDRAPEGAFVTLLGDPAGRPLYRRHGFVETAPASVGMKLRG